jgi:hypothetical protein
MIEDLLERVMIKALDHSRAAKPCAWMCGELKYVRIGHDLYQTESDWWCETGVTGYASEVRHDSGRIMSRRTQYGRTEIFAGYVWDGPSGRFPLVPVLQTYDTPDSMIGSLFHDDWYRVGRLHKLPKHMRKPGDVFAYSIWRQRGMHEWRAKRWLWALRTFAEFAFTSEPEDLVVIK